MIPLKSVWKSCWHYDRSRRQSPDTSDRDRLDAYDKPILDEHSIDSHSFGLGTVIGGHDFDGTNYC